SGSPRSASACASACTSSSSFWRPASSRPRRSASTRWRSRWAASASCCATTDSTSSSRGRSRATARRPLRSCRAARSPRERCRSRLSGSPVNLALCFLAARLVYLVVCVVLYARVVGVSWARPSPGEAWRMVVQSSPFAFYALSAALSLQLGTVMLSYFAGEAAVGEFQQALRFGMAATIPLAIAEVVFYAFLADVRARAPDQFARRLVLLNKVGATVIAVLTVAMLLYAPDLVRAAYGGRTAPVVGTSLRIVMGAYCCLYLLFVSPPLMALGRDRANLTIWALGAAVNVAANVLLDRKSTRLNSS